MKQESMKVLFFIRKSRLKKNGEAPIFLRVTINGQLDEVRIQRSVPLKLWDNVKERSKGKDRSSTELNSYISTPMYDKRMELARRAFIFSTLTGLAYVDIKLLHPHHIGTNADGRRYIRINRKKTKVEAFIPLHPIAERILSLYNTTDDEKPVFPLPNRDALWFEVHELGITIGKEENLTYHQSRHSFGTFLISADIPIESIAKMMGHSNIRTTQGYARITDDKISKDMDKLMERRKEISSGEKKK